MLEEIVDSSKAHKAIREAQAVFVAVMGPDDVFYAQISKKEAHQLFEDSHGQLAVTVTDRNAYFDRAY